ncbi:putative metallodependent hydrolase [Salmonella sp. NCTC 11881]|nr:putative metallodependent hydrolase [Salmonella sp. NCTC 11881]
MWWRWARPGFDYFYTPETKIRQQASFIHHIQIGRELHKPVIVHTRDARADTLAILREEKSDGFAAAYYTVLQKTEKRPANCWIWGFISLFPAS